MPGKYHCSLPNTESSLPQLTADGLKVPLAVSLPAAAAGLAYLNAKSAAWYDLHMLGSALGSAVHMFRRARKGGLNVFYTLEERAKHKNTSNKPFILFGDKSYTYGDVYDRTLRYGTWLKQTMGVREKDIVALDFMNSDNYVFLLFALWSIGAKPAFINYNLRDVPLTHCAKAAKSKLMLVDPAVADAITDDVRKALPGMRIELFSSALEAEALATPPIRYPDEVRYEDTPHNMAILIYTSGTTGLPKPAVVSWAKVIVAGDLSGAWTRTRPTDIYYTVSLPQASL
jgi:acyl-CoA synthetase (AMP-forming)/AMP-acid ligase II